MAAIPVTFIGTLTYTDVGVGGGPMPGGPEAPPTPTHPIVIPPDAIAPGVPTHPIVIPQPPLGFWGGVAPPLPTHPIAPGGAPPSIWPSPGTPAHPIVLPPENPPTEPPTGESEGSWAYSPAIGWYWTSPGGRWVYVAGDKPAPPQVPGQPPPA